MSDKDKIKKAPASARVQPKAAAKPKAKKAPASARVQPKAAVKPEAKKTPASARVQPKAAVKPEAKKTPASVAEKPILAGIGETIALGAQVVSSAVGNLTKRLLGTVKAQFSEAAAATEELVHKGVELTNDYIGEQQDKHTLGKVKNLRDEAYASLGKHAFERYLNKGKLTKRDLTLKSLQPLMESIAGYDERIGLIQSKLDSTDRVSEVKS